MGDDRRVRSGLSRSNRDCSKYINGQDQVTGTITLGVRFA